MEESSDLAVADFFRRLLVIRDRSDDPICGGSNEGELAQSGAAMGTIAHRAPEFALSISRVDAKSDIYGLGCTLYLVLTGVKLFGGETMVEKVLAHREHLIPLGSPDVPQALERSSFVRSRNSPNDGPRRRKWPRRCCEGWKRVRLGTLKLKPVSNPTPQDRHGSRRRRIARLGNRDLSNHSVKIKQR